MDTIFINFSNHPSTEWSKEQKEEALTYGETLIDIPFPNVNPYIDEIAIAQKADEYVLKIKEIAEGKSTTVHIMGEMNLTYLIIQKLIDQNICCVSSTSERDVEILEDGSKNVFFKFIRFRKYGL